MADIPLDQVVRLAAWDVSNGGPGIAHGSCLTAMWHGSEMTLRLMKTAGPDYYKMTPAPARFFLPEDQHFVLVPESGGGFRIVKHQTDMCLEGGPWWAPRGTRIAWLSFQKLNEESASQVFFAEKEEGSEVEAFKFFCFVDGERADLMAERRPPEQWAGVELGNPGPATTNLFAVQPLPGTLSPTLREPSPVMNLRMTNARHEEATFDLTWNDGSLPPLHLKAFESGIMTLDGVNPPHGTTCRVSARAAGKVIEGDTFGSGPAMYSPYAEYRLVDFMSAQGPDVGFEISLNTPRG